MPDAENTPRTVYVTLYQDKHSIYDKLGLYIQFLQAKLSEIPAECRDTANIEIVASNSYDDDYNVETTINYRKLETQEEADARVLKVQQDVEQQRQYEIRQLLDLKKKYPEV